MEKILKYKTIGSSWKMKGKFIADNTVLKFSMTTGNSQNM